MFPNDDAVVEWAKGALEGLRKGAPTSLFVTQTHYAKVAAAASAPSDPLAEVSVDRAVLLKTFCMLMVGVGVKLNVCTVYLTKCFILDFTGKEILVN